jgi:hypothetical protein
VRESDVDRDAPAEGVRDQRDAVDAEVVEERADVVDVGERPAGQRRLSEAAQVRADDAVDFRKGLELAGPEAPVADARVQERDRKPLAGRVVGELGAVDRGRAQLSLACAASR